MTYKFKARLSSEWVLEKPSGTVLALSKVLRLLAAIDATGHIAGACKACSLSYRHGWGLLRNAEKEFEAPLIETSRPQATKLTNFGQHLNWANSHITSRSMPQMGRRAGRDREGNNGLD